MLVKRYRCDELLASWPRVAQRIELIERHTPVRFRRDGAFLFRHTPRARRRARVLARAHVFGISRQVLRYHAAGLVHGDIHLKNIVLDSAGRALLSDWEPWLRQILHGQPVLMVTYPWIDARDHRLREVSPATDQLCLTRLSKLCA